MEYNNMLLDMNPSKHRTTLLTKWFKMVYGWEIFNNVVPNLNVEIFYHEDTWECTGKKKRKRKMLHKLDDKI